MAENPSALSSVPAAGARRGLPASAQLRYFYGPMDCGKSTLALQIDHNHARQGRYGLLLTQNDRSSAPVISSRMGMGRPAVDVTDQMDLRRVVRDLWARGQRVDYIIVDEAQFLHDWQIDQLAELVDASDVDVYAFGLITDFRSQLFPGSKRLLELADEVTKLQVEVLCWCGRLGAFNGRVVGRSLVKEGAQVMVADTTPGRPGTAMAYGRPTTCATRSCAVGTGARVILAPPLMRRTCCPCRATASDIIRSPELFC